MDGRTARCFGLALEHVKKAYDEIEDVNEHLWWIINDLHKEGAKEGGISSQVRQQGIPRREVFGVRVGALPRKGGDGGPKTLLGLCSLASRG